jgi:2'-5' RNA ligase
VLVELTGDVAAEVAAIQAEFDPKLARLNAPHVTIVGSSGAGPIAPSTTAEELRAALAPIAAATPAMTLTLSPPVRFMQTEIIVIPLAPYGPLRDLHERIRATGLNFGRPRFAFTPHITLSFYPTLSAERRRSLLARRVPGPAFVDHIECSLTIDPQPSRRLLEVALSGIGSRESGVGSR